VIRRGHTRTVLVADRLLTLAAAALLDWLVGEPPAAMHPVVWIGRFANGWIRHAPVRQPVVEFAFGLVTVTTTVGLTATIAATAARLVQWLPLACRLPVAALLLKPSFAHRELLRAAERVRLPLERDDLPGARTALSDLVSRDPSSLGASSIAAAAIQSLAENAADSVVAPWLAFIVGGLPGAYAYRAANTLDAMVGYRGRYEHLGKAAARLDDLVNLAPARITAAGFAATAGPIRGRNALALVRRDHGRTPSPNGGWPMAAMAGALGVRLEKVGHYSLGDGGRPPSADDIAAARRAVTKLVLGATMGCAVAGAGLLCRERFGGAT
jgi:adenosylcobinamide-phosphate synthase